jgi:hypothetical protein
MSSTSSTAHRRDFCRALYLQPSINKLGARCICSFYQQIGCSLYLQLLSTNWVLVVSVVSINKLGTYGIATSTTLLMLNWAVGEID